MRILFVASEVYPFSKTGGLADVAGALPQALVGLGHEVLVVSPWYDTLTADPAPLWIGEIEVPFDGATTSCGLGTLERNGVSYAFVGHGDFRRDRIYGFDDDARRFARFTCAVAPAARRLVFRPQVVHLNDWHSAYLPVLLAHGAHMPDGFSGLPSVLTVHNIQYQGVSGLDETLAWLMLPGKYRDSYINHFGSANAMQAGLGFAAAVTTVSPSYAQEIQTPEYGYGLDETLRHIAPKLKGILNGLDTQVWDPATDAHLPAAYSAADPGPKAASKKELGRRFGLEPGRPLMGVVSRLADQKGIDVWLEAVPGLLEQGWNLFLLGSGETAMEAYVRRLTAENAGRMGSVVGYDETLAHLVYGAADTLAVPSRFEPCGLSQMIAMRYGTPPVARATGGLKDTIDHGRTGFLFEEARSGDLLGAAAEALADYRSPARWRDLMTEAMREDFSWERSAQAYVSIYRQSEFEAA